MAPALVSSQGGTAVSGTTATYTVTSTGTAAGTGLCLLIGWRIAAAASQTITSVTDDKGNTWIQEFTDNDPTSTVKADIWSVTPKTYISGVTSITVTFSIAASSAWYFYEVSGGDAVIADWGDQGIGGHGSSTAPTASSGTLGQASEFVMGGIVWGSNVSTLSGVTSGWTLDTLETATSPNLRTQPVHQITSATTALTLAGTLSASGRWSVMGVTFRASTGTAAALAGSDTLTFTESATPSVAVALGASDAVAFGASAVPSAAVSLQGTGIVAFGGSGSLAELVAGSGALAFGATATLTVAIAVALGGTAGLALIAAGTLGGSYPGAGCSYPVPLSLPAYDQGNLPAANPVLLGALALPPQPTAVPVLTGSQAGC